MRKSAMNVVQRIAVTLLALSFVCFRAPAAQATNVVSAPLNVQAGALNGMVRVYLSSLGSPTALTLTVAGNYSINGNVSQSLTNGESVTVGFSSSTGAITLTRGGVKTNMGTNFALRRHSTTGTNGIKIAQARMPSNPYPGDLSFRAVQSGGGYKLYTIAHVYIESYLYGVLPYEMGNSSHIEALKAQAVAARTYTVNMMQSRASGTYDVVDTTSDQVYNGTPSGNANCVAAVDATKGIVVKNGSSYTGTYYSASNGGQTESAANLWGSSGYGYLSVKDDPFDLANPDCVVKKATVYASVSGTNSSLLALLKSKAVSALNSSGYSATSDNTTLQTVKNITPHSPKYAVPSKLYTKMDFSLTASTRDRYGSTATATVTVTCNVFTELESMLGMSIQSSSNELWSVAKNGSNFVLEARRYGHGIGMSQRGAMYMGRQGYTYDQILGFYYNDCKRVRISFTNTILAAGSSDTQTTVEDPADFTEGDTGCTGVVKLVSSGSSLAIRAEKSTSGSILGVIANNSPVSIYANDGTWCFIRFGNIQGYVPTNALSITGTAPATTAQTVTQISGFAKVTATGYLNLRASGSSSATIMTTAPTGAILTVFSNSGGWAHIQFGATVAYASADFLSFSSTYPGSAASSGSMTAIVALDDPAGFLNLRSTPSTSGAVLTTLANGTQVTVTRDDGSWSFVTVNGISGYVVSSSLRFEDGGTSGDPAVIPGTQEETAVVNTTNGVLYQAGDTNSAAIMTIGLGQSVVVLEKGSAWCQVRYDGITGYMQTAVLTFQASSGSGGQGEKAIVATQSGSLNLRREASAGSSVLTTIPKGTQINVTSRGTTWSAVTYNGVSGYVMSSFLQFVPDGGQTDPTTDPSATTPQTAWVSTQSGSLNLRAEARAGSAILRTIPRLATVTVLSRGAEWCQVSYSNATGYVMSVFLAFDAQTVTPAPEETPQNGVDEETDSQQPVLPEEPAQANAIYAKVTTVSGSLNMRQNPLPGSPILTRIPKGVTLVIQEKMAAWSLTTYGNQQGYVMNSYLTFMEQESPVDSSVMATVVTASGSLNMRIEPSVNAGILLRIPRSAQVLVQQRGTTWTQVSYAGSLGYVMSQYLSFPETVQAMALTDPAATVVEPTPTPVSAQGQTAAWVSTSGGSLNLRGEASGNGHIQTTIPNTAAVTVLVYGDVWCQVSYGDFSGYVMTQYLRFQQAQSSEAAQTSQSQTLAWVNTPSGSLNMRQASQANAAVVTTIPKGAQVTVLQSDSAWSKVRYGSWEGYVVSTYLSATEPALSVPTATEEVKVQSAAAQTQESQSNDVGLIVDTTLQAVVTTTYAQVQPRQGNTMLSLWAECSERGVPLLTMLRNDRVQVLMIGDTWCQIKVELQTGYCLKEYLLIEGLGS